MTLHRYLPRIAFGAALLASTAFAADLNIDSVRMDEGKHFNSDDVPTYKVEADGTVDWFTFSGFRRYHSDCHVCHGPDGEGSTYAPALKESVKNLDYYEFVDVITNGRQVAGAGSDSVMPSFGTNPNVMCYLDDIYIYLRARSTDAVPRGRPAKRGEKPGTYASNEKACLGG